MSDRHGPPRSNISRVGSERFGVGSRTPVGVPASGDEGLERLRGAVLGAGGRARPRLGVCEPAVEVDLGGPSVVDEARAAYHGLRVSRDERVALRCARAAFLVACGLRRVEAAELLSVSARQVEYDLGLVRGLGREAFENCVGLPRVPVPADRITVKRRAA